MGFPHRALAVGLLFACGCGPARPNRAVADIYSDDNESSGSEKKRGVSRGVSTDIDDDDPVRTLFLEVADAKRIRTCAPAAVAWVIIAYAPEVLDQHRVRTREIHCQERAISDRCEVVADVRYYLDDPNDYFSAAGVPAERALQIAQLARARSQYGRLLAVAADKGGVYLITLGDCGTETQLAVRLKGSAAERRLEVVEIRYSVQL